MKEGVSVKHFMLHIVSSPLSSELKEINGACNGQISSWLLLFLTSDDPSWNPATDAQAVDRCFRIGQDKNVVVYRLITCGSIEEKIYRRQVFKDSINKQTQGDTKNPYR